MYLPSAFNSVASHVNSLHAQVTHIVEFYVLRVGAFRDNDKRTCPGRSFASKILFKCGFGGLATKAGSVFCVPSGAHDISSEYTAEGQP